MGFTAARVAQTLVCESACLKSPLSFTPGFSPVVQEVYKSGTVSTVSIKRCGQDVNRENGSPTA
jgi:hypothetical protein